MLAVVAVGLGIWAFSLQSDIDDKDAQIAAQQQELDEQQQSVAGQVQEAAGGVADDAQQALSELAQEIEQVQGTADATQAETQAAIDQAEQAAADARAKVESAGDEVAQVQAEADEAKAQAEAAVACARGYLSALAGIPQAASIEDGVTQAQERHRGAQRIVRRDLGLLSRRYCGPSSSAGAPRPRRALTRARTRPGSAFCLRYCCATEVSRATSTPNPVRM